MTGLTQLLLISLCVCAHSAPLGELHRHRSDYGVYANDYAQDYEPYMYAAIPLHRPMPVLHVLSKRPLAPRDRNIAPSVHHPVYARPPYPDNDYAPSAHNDYDYAGYGYTEPQSYRYPPQAAASYEQYDGPAASASQDEVTILYARPNPHGGFLYRKRPSKSSPKRTPVVSSTESPVIIRVHRYKVVKDL